MLLEINEGQYINIHQIVKIETYKYDQLQVQLVHGGYIYISIDFADTLKKYMGVRGIN